MKRVQAVVQQVNCAGTGEAGGESITVKDNRTGKEYTLPIKDNTIKATDLKQIKSANGKPLKTFDPGYMNTTCCISTISFIDGDKGILRYRGIPIEQLAEKSSFLECAYLLIYGKLPAAPELKKWERDVMAHSATPLAINKMHEAFRYDAHPMGMLTAAFAALGTYHPEANPALAGQGVYSKQEMRNKQIARILGNGPALAAVAYRHRLGLPYREPNPELSYAENFLYQMDIGHEDSSKFKPHPTLAKAIDILFILHAEHELNCSTSAVRHLASSNVDVYTAISGACGALYGPRHGGANEAVLRMLEEIGDVSKVDAFVEKVKRKEAKLMGFGHRVYKSYDPRAKCVRNLADDVFKLTGTDPLIEVAMALEKHALNDKYFIDKKLYPNVDFYSGLIYKAMGIPTDMFTVFFAIPRLAGWLAHWQEWTVDPENRIYRPFQIYKGVDCVDYTEMGARKDGAPVEVPRTAINTRRDTTLGQVRPKYINLLPGTSD